MWSGRVKKRLAGLGVALAATYGLVVWVAHSASRRVERLNDDFTRGQLESFNIAWQWQVDLNHLQGLLLLYVLRGDTNDFARFMLDQKALDAWLDDQRTRVHTADEREALAAIDRAYDVYRDAAFKLGKGIAAGSSVDRLSQYIEATVAEFEHLSGLDRTLLQAHSRAREEILERGQRDRGFVSAALFGSLAALAVAVLALAAAVWRGLIEPLRRELIESRDLLARHEKLASLGVLAAGVAHEIRNPLTAIKARLFTQRLHLAGGSPAANDAAVIGAEIERLEKIVKDFLRFARPSDPAITQVPVSQALADLQDLLAEDLLAQRRIRLEAPPADGLAARADPAQLKQVLINLVQNAAEAIDHDGVITLSARRTSQRLGGVDRQAVVIEVADTGPGIPVEAQERLFDPFFTTKDRGTGLGLSIAARIVERHGGVIRFETEPGRGATFSVALPEATSMPDGRPERVDLSGSP